MSDPHTRLLGEHDLIFQRLRRKTRKNLVAQDHTIATAQNIGLIRHFGITPLVLVRNLPDVCLSYRDHLVKEPGKTELQGAIGFGFPDWSLERQLDFIIDMIIPWYLKFYVSWSRQPYVMVSYEQMVANPVVFFKSLLGHCGHEIGEAAIAATLDRNRQATDRFNQGIVGRGSLLTSAQVGRIENMVAYYPEVNFDRVMSRPDVTVSKAAI